VTTPPTPAAPRGRHSGPVRASGVTRIVRTDELPDGVDALASADGRTIIVRDTLDPVRRRRAMREVMASIRRYPRLALLPAVAASGLRNLLRRISAVLSDMAGSAQQLAVAAADHVNAIAIAVTAVAGTAVAVTAVAVVPSPSAGSAGPGQAAAPGGHREVPAASRDPLPARPLSYLGVFEPGAPASFGPVSEFNVVTGHRPDIALYYSGWHESFRTAFAEQAWAAGTIPAVQIEPFGASMAAIAAGQDDDYLRRFAGQVAAYGHPVIIGFAHEPNGTWYPWGARLSPAVWTAAWRHVVRVFRAQGADNVTWLWTVNAQGPYAAEAAAWYPGAAYVDWVGIDGYYTQPGQDFGQVFGPGLTAVQSLGKPVLIAETAVGRQPAQGAEIANLFAGVRRDRLLGLIWFDAAQDRGPYQQDWRLEGNQAAAAAFRASAGGLR